MDISVIIINYHSEDLIKSCLNSLRGVFGNEVAVYIVDNSSFYSKINELYSSFKKITVISLGKNIGFAKANNLGAKSAKTKYLLFLNPDTIIFEDFFDPIITFIESNQEAGACAPMLLYNNLRYQSSTGFRVGVFYEFLEAFMLIGLIRKLSRIIHMKQVKSGKPFQVGWVSGACFVIRKDTFDKVSGFSEDYFLNYEDIDLCRKIEDAGFKNYYFPGVKCVHLNHRSFSDNYDLLVTSRYKSRLIYAGNYYSIPVRFIVRILHLSGIILRLLLCSVLYSRTEREQRFNGYLKSLKMLLSNKI